MATGDTFAIQTGTSMVQPGPAVNLGNIGLQGGGRIQRGPQMEAHQMDTSTMQAMLNIGKAVLEPALRKREAELFLQGAQRVAQGDALGDIVNEQPWYTKIFGESATIQGARTIAQISQVDQYVSGLYGDMDKLQTMSREEVGAEVNKRMMGFLTGDAVADAAIQQKMVEASGEFYNAHAKANYKWMQTTMQTEVSGMMRSAADSMQAANSQRVAGTLSEDDWLRVKERAAGSMLPLAWQSPESYWAAVEGSTIDAMANGNHHFAGLLFSSGLFDQAPDKVRKKLLDARATYEARTVEREGFLEYGARIGELQGMARAGVISPAQLTQEVVAMNEDFRVRTGIEGDLLSKKTFASMLAGDYSAIYKRRERNAREAAKDAAKGQTDMARLSEIHQGLLVGAGGLLQAAGHKQSEVTAVMTGVVDEAIKAGVSPMPILVDNYIKGDSYVHPPTQNKMQAALRAAKGEAYSGKAFDNAHALAMGMTSVPGGSAALLGYLGEEDGARMLEYDALLKAEIPPELAYSTAFGKPLNTAVKSSDKKVMARLNEIVEAESPGWWSEKLGKAPLNAASERIVASTLAQSYDLLGSVPLGDDAKFKIGMDVARQKLDIVGPFAYAKRAGQLPISALLGTDDATAGKLLQERIRNDMKAQGLKVELADSVASNTRALSENMTDNALNLLPGIGPIIGTAPWMYKHYTRKQPDVLITRSIDQYDPESKQTYSTFSVFVTDPDGRTGIKSYDSRELRKEYEKSSYYK